MRTIWKTLTPPLIGLSALLGVACDSGSPSDAAAGASQTEPAKEESPAGMKWIPGGTFLMGSKGGFHADESPAHRVKLDGFWLDETEITNAQFQIFVESTGYRTVAETGPSEEQFPYLSDPRMRVPGSTNFRPTEAPVANFQNELQWWEFKQQATWRHPQGEGSSIADKMDHPVICLTWVDAKAYADWAGKRLPTEAE